MCEFCNLDRGMAEVSAAGHCTESEWFWAELLILREKWDVWRHPFYMRWSAGELSRRQLQVYAEEYDHLAVALAIAARNAADKADGLLGDTLKAHAEQAKAQIDAWREFAASTGWCPGSAWYYGADPYPATVECARLWAGDPYRPLATDLVTLIAAESAQPNHEHAAILQPALQGVLANADPFALIAQAEAVHRSYWGMLDAIGGVVVS